MPVFITMIHKAMPLTDGQCVRGQCLPEKGVHSDLLKESQEVIYK